MSKIKVQTYKVRWWGCPGSVMGRPTYRILDIDNGCYRIRYGMIPGRRLDNYVLPYWPITSFLSIYDPPAELATQTWARFQDQFGPREEFLVAGDPSSNHRLSLTDPSWAAFQLARDASGVVLRVANSGGQSPIHMEHYLRVTAGKPTLSLLVRTVNNSELELRGVQTAVRYQQDFNWSHFTKWADGSYRPARGSGAPKAFHAFSSGMGRGFEFASVHNCGIDYALEGETGAWRVDLANTPADLGPAGCSSFSYLVRVTDRTPTGRVDIEQNRFPFDPDALSFAEIKPRRYRAAPRTKGRGVSMEGIMRRFGHPWVRGLNLRASFPGALDDIRTLREWGCNLLITGTGEVDQITQIASKAHSLGMESLLQGSGSFRLGRPTFEGLTGRELAKAEMPDSFGQDEDHYYWHSVTSTRDFQRDFGKPAACATLEEKVTHYSRCFADKWRGVLEDVRGINPDAGVWFYTPTPGIANVDPLDCNGIFIREATEIGQKLTVFPFYYGVDFGQAEYMVRSWKRGSAGRVVFLPMRDFMVRPSQFFRAITAARRGGADGACGFSFKVGESTPEEAWQWKSVMLAAWANFPTPELDAICAIEEPAQLVEAMGMADIALIGSDLDGLASKLGVLLPGNVTTRMKPPSSRQTAELNIHVNVPTDSLAGRLGVPGDLIGGGGIITMDRGEVFVGGRNQEEVENATHLLGLFAQLARAEHAANADAQATRT